MNWRCLLFLLLVLSGCGGDLYRGRLIYAHEARSFQPCGEKQLYWLQPEAEMSQQMSRQYQSLVNVIYQPVYVEFIGTSVASGAEFATDYNATLKPERIEIMTAELPQGCQLEGE